MSDVVVAIDQGTSSTKGIALDSTGCVVARASVPVTVSAPRPGAVEQDPEEILESVVACLTTIGSRVDGVAAVGLSNQRESALVWDAASGRPLSPLLGWQDRRTAARATALADSAAMIRKRTGLPLDPMFSALKLGWILDDLDPERRLAAAGRLRAGTLDSWLLDRLTGDFRIEAGNASRTQLLRLDDLDWDDDLLELFGVPRACLPPVVRSDAASASLACLPGARVTAVMGDSHAALYGHGVRAPGQVKATFGTGSSVMGLTPADVPPASGLVGTVAWWTQDVARAFEGNILATGATLVWLSGLFGVSTDTLATWARAVEDTAGVVIVPAFSGLGAPTWDTNARALIVGFDQSATRAHLARAAFESVAHQIADVLEGADLVAGRIDTVMVDGGPSRNDWLMQMQADLSRRRVLRPADPLLSATGVARLAGVSAGVWSDDSFETQADVFTPGTPDPAAARDRWANALARSRWRASE